jgi:protein-disulfide isomerase
MRFAYSALLSATLLASPAMAFDINNMTEAERAAFNQAVRDYLVANPDVLVESYATLQRQEEAAQADKEAQVLADNHDTIFNDPNSWVGGNLQGDITVVEFIDYRCGYCRKAWEEVDQLVNTDGNIRFVLKEFPILGDQSILASRFAIAVRMLHGDEAYRKTHDALLTMRADATPETLTRLAGDLGIDPGPLAEKMNSDEVTAIIAANHQLGTLLEVNGTPTFVVGGTMVRGYLPLEGMQQIVAEARDKAG